ncbi:MAG: hypothetical protein WD793_09105 [Steroidobacteraceae bacterium]
MLPLSACVAGLDAPDDGERSLASWLRRLPPGPVAAAGIGALYLRDRPDEQSADWLARRLFDTELSRPLDRAGFQELLSRVVAKRARDFLEEDLVVVNGWAVSRTEARLLALIALCGDA